MKFNRRIKNDMLRKYRRAVVQLASPQRSVGTDTGGHEKACTGTARQARPFSGKNGRLPSMNTRAACDPVSIFVRRNSQRTMPTTDAPIYWHD